MISIIISSADAVLLQQVKENVSETVGVPFEIIAIDNSDGKQGICAVYNQGAAQAKHDILCFMHEDIAIKTCGFQVTFIFNYFYRPFPCTLCSK